MAFIPNTIFRLCKGVPLDNSYKDTMLFDSVYAQTVYFYSKIKYDFSDFTYQKITDSVCVPIEADAIYDCNYVMFANNNWGNKWFYGFIKSIKYVSPKASEITYEIDAIQTWMFDYTIMPSFTEREHVNDDTIFWNQQPENFEFGDNIITADYMYDLSSMAIVVAFATLTGQTAVGEMRDGVYTGLTYLWFGTTTDEITQLNGLLDLAAQAGELQNIIAIFMIPAQFVLGGDAGITLKSTFSSIDGYKPKNKKLFCFPYHYLALTNCAGTEAQYKFEYFDTPTNIHFTIDYAYNMSASCNAHPDNYKGMEDNWDEGIVLTNFPVCSWTGNVYANWLALNKMQISNAQIGAIGSTALGAIGGSVLGGIGGLLGAVGGAVSGISKITDIMAQQFQRSLVPYQVQGQIKCAVSNVKWHRVGYQLKVYGIKAGYAKLLDDYFTMFGYKINRLKVPNIRGRKSWNYVKTIDVNIVGSLPVDNMINIKNAFNRGITFWHGDFIGDYTRDNSIGVATGTTPPQLTGAQTSANGWVVTLTFDKYMNNPANKQSEFVLKINDVESPLAYIQYNSDFRKYDLGLLNNAIVDTDTVTISYIQGTITADDNSALGSFTNYPVNNIAPELIVNRDNIYNYLASHTQAGIVAITNDDIDTFLDNVLTLNKSIKAFYLQKAYSTGTLGIKVVLITAYDRESTLVWSDNNPVDYVNSSLSAHAVISPSTAKFSVLGGTLSGRIMQYEMTDLINYTYYNCIETPQEFGVNV